MIFIWISRRPDDSKQETWTRNPNPDQSDFGMGGVLVAILLTFAVVAFFAKLTGAW